MGYFSIGFLFGDNLLNGDYGGPLDIIGLKPFKALTGLLNY